MSERLDIHTGVVIMNQCVNLALQGEIRNVSPKIVLLPSVQNDCHSCPSETSSYGKILTGRSNCTIVPNGDPQLLEAIGPTGERFGQSSWLATYLC